MRELFIKQRILDVYKECNVRSFPINCFALLMHYGFITRTYGEAQAKDPLLYEAIRSYSDDAIKYHKCIYYNQKATIGRIRFSLMHELGHHILGHVGQNQQNEDEADFFASNILAPRLMMYRLHCKNADDIHATFNISYAASNRAIREYHKWIACDIDKKMNAWFFPMEESKAEDTKVIKTGLEKSESKDPWVPSREFEERKAKILARRNRRKRRLEKKLKQYYEDMAFIGGIDPDVAFSRAERQWLYGNDL